MGNRYEVINHGGKAAIVLCEGFDYDKPEGWRRLAVTHQNFDTRTFGHDKMYKYGIREPFTATWLYDWRANPEAGTVQVETGRGAWDTLQLVDVRWPVPKPRGRSKKWEWRWDWARWKKVYV